MAGRIDRAWAGLSSLIVALLLATLLTPLSALADTDLVPGGTAVIAYANGDDVRLREGPGYDAGIIRYIPEGATVDVLDYPSEDGDGNFWYPVVYDGDSGYVVSDYLALDSSAGAAVEAETGGSAPAGEVIGYALISGTNNDGVRCRAGADPGAAVITVVPEDTTVELTGAAVGAWQPINCAGQGGYVHTAFVSYDFTQLDPVDDSEIQTAALIGEATVTGTNGDGVRCRASASYNASIITVLAEGSTVTLRDVVNGDFQGVVCAGANGFAASMYLSSGGGAGGDEIVGEATVSGTNGDGVRCRSDASTSASIITVLTEGETVPLRSGGGDWLPVVCGGENGFIFSGYLSTGGSDGSSSGVGLISGTNGDGVRCRTQPSFNGAVITVIAEGVDVAVRGGADGDWVPIVCAGSDGWVHADFISIGSTGGNDGGGSDGPSNSGFVSGDKAVVSGTNGDGVRLRSGASFDAAIITVVAEGKRVLVIDGSTGDWVAVSVSGTSGYIHMDYLISAAEQSDSDGGGAGLGSGDHALALSALNLRYDPSFGSGVAAVAPEGTVVQVTGGPSNGFYPVDWDGLQGYMHGDYLSWTDEPLSERGGSGDDGGSDGGGGGGAGGGNSAIVDFAMQYLGYPYVWATHGPSSFDCSGFTYWVIVNTLGIDISYGTSIQIGYGTPVARSDLQPGDLVFFQNTYTWGLSHVGIYIGDDKFIHAENESTGVVISSLSSSYYASRWYGARRIG